MSLREGRRESLRDQIDTEEQMRIEQEIREKLEEDIKNKEVEKKIKKTK